MLILVFRGGTEVCSFVARELKLGNGYLITPPRTRAWPVAPGDVLRFEDGEFIGVVASLLQVQFQRYQINIVPQDYDRVVDDGDAMGETTLDDGGNPKLANLPLNIVTVLAAQGVETDADVEAKFDEGDMAILALRGIGPKALGEIRVAFGRSE